MSMGFIFGRSPFVSSLLLVCWLALDAVPALGGNVSPGIDLWTPVAGPDTYIVFGGGPVPVIPADFFGPDSQPFATAPTAPEPMNPPGASSSINPDTVVRRPDPTNFPAPGGNDQIPIEIVEMNLVSAQPITVNFGGTNPHTEQWNFRLTLNPSPSSPTQGAMSLQDDNPGIPAGLFTFSIWVTRPESSKGAAARNLREFHAHRRASARATLCAI